MEAQKAETRGLSDPARRGRWESKSREEWGPSVLCPLPLEFSCSLLLGTKRGQRKLEARNGVRGSEFTGLQEREPGRTGWEPWGGGTEVGRGGDDNKRNNHGIKD